MDHSRDHAGTACIVPCSTQQHPIYKKDMLPVSTASGSVLCCSCTAAWCSQAHNFGSTSSISLSAMQAHRSAETSIGVSLRFYQARCTFSKDR
eukprot:2974216-Pleurochrysis_carterae.AAC.2